MADEEEDTATAPTTQAIRRDRFITPSLEGAVGIDR
jgi:hypothetical protein